jgi:phage/plasmid-associated DNA primase
MKSNEKAETALTSIVSISMLTDASVESQLTAKHLDDLVTNSAISPEIALLGCESFKNGKDIGINYHQSGTLYKSVNPITGEINKAVFSARLDLDKKSEKDKDIPRYPSPKGYSPDVFFCPMTDPGFWLAKIYDKKHPIFLAEGWKKAASILSQGRTAIGIPSGATFFQSSNQKNPDEPLEGLQAVLDKERPLYVILDADFQINENVARTALNNLEKLVKGRSRYPFEELRIVIWEYSPNIKGIDDLLAATDGKDRPELLAKLMRESLTIEQFREYLQTIKFDNSYYESNESLEDAVLRIIDKQHPYTYFKTEYEWFEKKDGTRLHSVEDADIKVMIASVLRSLVKIGAKGDRKQNLATTANTENCYKHFLNDRQAKTKFQHQHNLLFAENGVFDADIDKLRTYTSEDISLINLPYAIDLNATCPVEIELAWYEKYCDPRLKPEEQLELLQAIIRFYLDVHKKGFGKFIHIIGKSNSGKGFLCDLIKALYDPENVSAINDVSELSDIKESYGYTRDGKRLCVGEDVKAQIKQTQSFYSLVTGATIPTRKMRENQSRKETVRYIRFLLASTSPLQTSTDANEGLIRRMIVLRTCGHIGQPTVGNIDFDKLVGQYASWALRMPRARMYEVLAKLQERNADEALLSAQAIARFAAQCLIRENDADRRHNQSQFTSETEMYDYYVSWTIYEGTSKLSRNKFNDRMKDLLENLYRPGEVKKVNGKAIRIPNRFVGLKPTAGLLDTSVVPNLIEPLKLIEGQTISDILREVDIREAPTYSQQTTEPSINYSPVTNPPVEPTAIAVESDELAF